MERGPVYRFGDVWTVPASPERVAAVLLALPDYPGWWPEVRTVTALDTDRARVRVRSKLPYTLDLRLTAVSRDLPNLVVGIDGDLAGWIRFNVRSAGTQSVVSYTQEVSARGALALATPIARRLLRWNHTRMMDSGRQGLLTAVGG